MMKPPFNISAIYYRVQERNQAEFFKGGQPEMGFILGFSRIAPRRLLIIVDFSAPDPSKFKSIAYLEITI
jgi:hypothetical protein